MRKRRAAMRWVELGLLVALAVPPGALAGGYGRVYLVPALKPCPGPATCVPREFQSSYTFDSIILHSPSGRYSPPNKPAFILEIRGVRDPAGTPVNGSVTLRVRSGRVSLPTLGTFPDDSPLVQTPPVPIPLKNGNNPRFSYKPATGIPTGTISNGGGVEVLDPDGKLLAVTGSQSKP
jgi:hypothetical protein